mmetsp:Transcript_56754/g.182279  ORF Transcript_56754/g.182279 Transcript_56754/m.182279 type:complete len:258 (-) Transcript_56754:88-861(-)
MAHPLEEVGRSVPENGGAQVPDVHLLRDVRRGVVDDDPLRLRAAELKRRAVPGLDLILDPGLPELHRHEALGRHTHLLEDCRGLRRQRGLYRLANLLGVLPCRGRSRLSLLLFEDAHRVVALVVAEARVGYGDLRVDTCRGRHQRGQRLLEEALQPPLQAHADGCGHGRLLRHDASAVPESPVPGGHPRLQPGWRCPTRRAKSTSKGACRCPLQHSGRQGHADHHGAHHGCVPAPGKLRPTPPARKGGHCGGGYAAL